MRKSVFRFGFSVLIVAFAASSGLAQDQPAPDDAPSFMCGGTNPKGVVLWPITKFSNGEFTNAGADCAMWQNFIYLNWPAAAGKRGVPDYGAQFGTPGTTVWETFLTSDQVFLPNGAKPQDWDSQSANATPDKKLAMQLATGQVRLLAATKKVSAAAVKSVEGNAQVAGIPLEDIEQAGNSGILYDQQKNPVYYEVAMNRAQFEYILNNGLYNADTQTTYAKTTNIVLPSGSMELKAAWKILTPAESQSGRFHMSKGYVAGSNGPVVDIGLVGLHVFASEGFQNAGLWATFYQIDNAPLQGHIGKGPYTFYNPASSTKPNDSSTNPTQVVQVFADDSSSITETKNAQMMFQKAAPDAPWQYYAMVATQWSQCVVNLNQPIPATLPLPIGKPDQILPSSTLMNPVLETFLQIQGTSCMGCHSYASGANSVPSGLSFMFSRAQAPK
ncbi:MAG: hypothetical protein R3C18_24930 [Planctomycetaceae bacterium]